MKPISNYVQSQPFIHEDDILSVVAVLRSLHLEEGENVRDLEKEVSTYFNKKYTCATINGFSAIHLALLALNIKPGDEVIIPAYTCFALLYPIRLIGATAVFADIADNAFNMSVATVENVLTAKTKAIIWPHMFGFPADLNIPGSLKKITIEDVAQSMGGMFKTKILGSFTDISISSFYATKNITAGDGGTVSLNSDRLRKKIEDIRYYGGKSKLKDKQYYNYKMGNLNAALALSQLKKIPTVIEKRKNIASQYDSFFSAFSKDVHTSFENKYFSCYNKYPILLPSVKIRDQLKAKLKENGVSCGYGVLEGLHKINSSAKDPSLKNTNNYLKKLFVFLFTLVYLVKISML